MTSRQLAQIQLPPHVVAKAAVFWVPVFGLDVAPCLVCGVKNVHHLGSIQGRSFVVAWPRSRPVRAGAPPLLALDVFAPEATLLANLHGSGRMYLRVLGGDVWALGLGHGEY